MRIGCSKKALLISAFFIAGQFILTNSHASSAAVVKSECQIKPYDSLATVTRVVDGDTIILSDKSKVRLIGINAPELAHYPRQAEAYALQAKQYIEAQFKQNKKVFLKFGNQRNDHYGRLLAHVSLYDGRNLNAMLIKQGLASAIVVPPNDNFNDCYFKLEEQARIDNKNIWSDNTYQYRDAETIGLSDTGFRYIKGKVIHLSQNRDSISLQLAPKFIIRIKRNDFKYFTNIQLEKLTFEKVKRITVFARGWCYVRNNALYMQVRHYSMIKGL